MHQPKQIVALKIPVAYIERVQNAGVLDILKGLGLVPVVTPAYSTIHSIPVVPPGTPASADEKCWILHVNITGQDLREWIDEGYTLFRFNQDQLMFVRVIDKTLYFACNVIGRHTSKGWKLVNDLSVRRQEKDDPTIERRFFFGAIPTSRLRHREVHSSLILSATRLDERDSIRCSSWEEAVALLGWDGQCDEIAGRIWEWRRKHQEEQAKQAFAELGITHVGTKDGKYAFDFIPWDTGVIVRGRIPLEVARELSMHALHDQLHIKGASPNISLANVPSRSRAKKYSFIKHDDVGEYINEYTIDTFEALAAFLEVINAHDLVDIPSRIIHLDDEGDAH